MTTKRWTSILFVALLALALGLVGCEQKTETPVEPPPAEEPAPPPAEEPTPPPAAAAVAIPAEYVAAAETEVTEENAEAIADELDKELEAELAE